MRYAIIDLDKNVVTNVIEYSTPPNGVPEGLSGNLKAIQDDVSSPGWLWDGVKTVNPDTTPPKSFDPLDTWDLVSLKISFNHENRIRAQEGKAAITLAQFKTAVRALL